MSAKRFRQGDQVVYRKTKHSPLPGPRAQGVIPSPAGDDYAYCVDKYWVVVDVTPEQKLVVKTRTGKMHTLDPDDPNLRHAHFWERWFLGQRFPDSTSPGQSEPSSATKNASHD